MRGPTIHVPTDGPAWYETEDGRRLDPHSPEGVAWAADHGVRMLDLGPMGPIGNTPPQDHIGDPHVVDPRPIRRLTDEEAEGISGWSGSSSPSAWPTPGGTALARAAADTSAMHVEHGEGRTPFGPGVTIQLTGDEVAAAIDAYLVAHNIHVDGPRTIRVNGKLCASGQVYVDPSGFVIADGKKISGRG